MSAEFPIYRVTKTGSVERLGLWRHDARELVLEREGYPLLTPGTHRIDGDLPWLFWDMTPSGFMGNRFAARNAPLLSLPSDPRTWNRDDVLRVLTAAGSELSGNLLIGDEARRQFDAWTPAHTDLTAELEQVLASQSTSGASSSLGGERPKLIIPNSDGTEVLAKFSPPIDSPNGQRWSDLLFVENLCTATLHDLQIDAVYGSTRVMQQLRRTAYSCIRFDRFSERGRMGTATLFWFSMARWGDIKIPAPEVTRRLVDSGELPPQDADTCATVHAFSAAIGNNDAHLGNYGLVFDDHGKARLAPIYDVLPMVFAPRHDELPDQYVKPRAEKPAPKIQAMVEDLAKRIEADENISKPFKELWLRYVGL